MNKAAMNKKTKEVFPIAINLEKCILVVGGPNRGLTFHGPFDTEGDAIDYADFRNFDEVWWVCRINQVQCDGDGKWLLP
jgi:hypothetical protein